MEEGEKKIKIKEAKKISDLTSSPPAIRRLSDLRGGATLLGPLEVKLGVCIATANEY